MLVGQVDADFSHIVAGAAGGPFEETVEIFHPCLADPGLVVDDVGLLREQRRDLAHEPVGLLYRRGLRHGDHDVESVFVVLRQEADRHAEGRHSAADTRRADELPGTLHDGRCHQQDNPGAECDLGDVIPLERGDEAEIESLKPSRLAVRDLMVMRLFLLDVVAVQPAVRRPGRDDVCNDDGRGHGDRHIECDWVEIVTGHAGDEKQGRKHQHDGKGREIGGVADLVGGENRHLRLRLPETGRRIVTMDVLDDHDCRVDKEPERENQGEERHPVDGDATQEVGKKGQRENERHGYHDDHGLTPPQKEDQHEADRPQCDQEVFEQEINRGVGFLAVVACHDDLDVLRDEGRLHALDALDHRLRHHDGVCALFLGDGDGDGRHVRGGRVLVMRGARSEGKPTEGGDLRGRSIGHRGDIADINGAAVMNGYNLIADVFGRGEGCRQPDGLYLIVAHRRFQRCRQVTCREGGIGLAQGHAKGLQAVRIEFDGDLAFVAALDVDHGNVLGAAQPFGHPLRDAPKTVVVVMR